VYTALNSTPQHFTFDQNEATQEKLKEQLKLIAKTARSEYMFNSAGDGLKKMGTLKISP